MAADAFVLGSRYRGSGCGKKIENMALSRLVVDLGLLLLVVSLDWPEGGFEGLSAASYDF